MVPTLPCLGPWRTSYDDLLLYHLGLHEWQTLHSFDRSFVELRWSANPANQLQSSIICYAGKFRYSQQDYRSGHSGRLVEGYGGGE